MHEPETRSLQSGRSSKHLHQLLVHRRADLALCLPSFKVDPIQFTDLGHTVQLQALHGLRPGLSRHSRPQPPETLCLMPLSLIHISEPTRLLSISYAVFCLKKKKPKIITSYKNTSISSI
eukprot:TRINITY_DN5320_c0_g1_i2.p1 TRINITY_DN5320_c0_g1~~TRINITY_DN5320_c0_g1_i2.p1  ORF type:complete len:120 (+),score=19.00 TRINITY_DN5320_c0_g1_i2:362-721(+)